MEESVRQKNKMEIYSLLLERIIAKAALEGDQLLTKKTCREKLKDALGLSTLNSNAARRRCCGPANGHSAGARRLKCHFKPLVFNVSTFPSVCAGFGVVRSARYRFDH